MAKQGTVHDLADRNCGADAVHALLVLALVTDPTKREAYLKDVLKHAYLQGLLAGLEAPNRARQAPPLAEVDPYLRLVV